jgi:glycosyltransferase involved in cell wall biosynthesis
MNILIYGTLIGPGGIAHHTREFTKRLATKHNVKFINFNVPTEWDGINTPNMYANRTELNDIHHQILHQQTLWSIDDSGKKLREFPLSGYDETFIPDVYLVMAEANHHYYYYPFESIDKPKIAYFPWETTKLRDDFFSRLQIFDQVWVPSQWQRDMVINQGYNPSKLHIVAEGVDPSVFFPIKKFEFRKFKFLHVGTWGYRKSTYEIIKSFIDIYGNNPDVELRLAINDKFLSASDEISNFNKFGLTKTDNIVFLETMTDNEYIEEIQNADVYISCARGEGWNLPLLQAMSSGVPSIWSKVGGQLQFADGAELGCDYLYELPATHKHNVNGIDWDWPTASGFPGNLYEPDFSQFSFYMKDVYNNYDFYKKKALEFSSKIHKNFDWAVSVNLAENLINNISNPNVDLTVNKTPNRPHLTSDMKIRVVHILIDVDSERERESIRSMSKLQDYGIEYIKYITQRYDNDAWKLQVPIDGWKNHSNTHYGAYLSFKDIFLRYFTNDIDALIILEADCILSDEISYDFFVDEIYNAIEFSKKNNVLMFSFGNCYCNNILQSPEVSVDIDYHNFYITDKIILNHTVLFTNNVRELLMYEYIHSNWDVSDIWHNSIFNKYKKDYNLGITRRPYTFQHEGISMIDTVFKRKS